MLSRNAKGDIALQYGGRGLSVNLTFAEHVLKDLARGLRSRTASPMYVSLEGHYLFVSKPRDPRYELVSTCGTFRITLPPELAGELTKDLMVLA